jgi:N-methylhydantoinase A
MVRHPGERSEGRGSRVPKVRPIGFWTPFPRPLDLIVHGTTTTTNAVLERRLARTGMITTKGFRDVIELGRRTRPQAYGMTGTFVPVIPRDLRLEVGRAHRGSGAVRQPLDEAGVRAPSPPCSTRAANRSSSTSCIPTPTRRTSGARPRSPPSSGRTATSPPAIRCCRKRASSSAASPRRQRLRCSRSSSAMSSACAASSEGLGYRRDFLIMNGNGGMISARFVTREAAKTVMSGPGLGRHRRRLYRPRAGYPNLVTYDMGGTSTDVALIRNAARRSPTRSRSNTRCRSTCRWSTCTRSAPAAARSRASMRRA